MQVFQTIDGLLKRFERFEREIELALSRFKAPEQTIKLAKS
jgi:hypothetical protein